MPTVARMQPVVARMSALAPLAASEVEALHEAIGRAQPIRARRELLTEGDSVENARLLVGGWAARVRLLPDGRRQLVSFVLPGDVLGLCHHPSPLAVSSVVALTDVSLCLAPAGSLFPGLARAFAVSRALDEAYLIAQVVRLGRLTAQERISDLLLELLERMHLAGLASGNAFDFPLTQEVLADALGLTSVHVNRMLQLSRKENDLHWKGGRLSLVDPADLARKIGRVPPRVSGASAAFQAPVL